MGKQVNIPELRFPEFNEIWKKNNLGNLSVDVMYGMNAAAIPFDGINKYLRITDIDDRFRYFSPNPLSSPDGQIEDKYKLKEGDIVFARTGASVGKSYLYKKEDGNLLFAGFLIKFSIVEVDPYFVFCQTLRTEYDKWVVKMSMRSGQPGLNAEEYKSLNFHIPHDSQEQQKIASFFTVIDQKIQTLKKKKDLMEEYKKGVVQKLFSQEIRMKDKNGKNYPNWKERTLGDVLFEHKLKSTGKEEVYSVSVHKGLINQIEHLGRSFAASNTDNYNLVQPNDIVYTKSPTGDFPLGIVKQSKIDKNVIVSPLYGIFTPETKGLGYLLDAYFESPVNTSNYLGSLIQKGAKNTINITNSTFLSKEMKLPVSTEEQEKIGDFLFAIDQKIQLLDQQINDTEIWKKGLLQKMFC